MQLGGASPLFGLKPERGAVLFCFQPNCLLRNGPHCRRRVSPRVVFTGLFFLESPLKIFLPVAPSRIVQDEIDDIRIIGICNKDSFASELIRRKKASNEADAAQQLFCSTA
jgi:hypothetical protein